MPIAGEFTPCCLLVGESRLSGHLASSTYVDGYRVNRDLSTSQYRSDFSATALASWLLWGKGITARRFLHAFRIQENGVATIFFISDEQRGPSELQVANKQPLIVLFTPPELDSGVKHLHLPQ